MSNIKSEFSLFKKPVADRESPYYFRFKYLGQSYTRCVRTNEAEEGQRRAQLQYQQIVDAVDRKDFPKLQDTKMRAPVAPVTTVPTMADLEKAYMAAPVDANASTRHCYILSMRHVLRVVEAVAEGQEGSLPITVISADTVAKWYEVAACQAAQSPDQAKAVNIKRSANSRFHNALAMLSTKALAAYKKSGCHHVCLDKVIEADRLLRFSRLPKIAFNPPVDDIIARTLEAWQSIQDRNQFLAIGHELAFGLRTHEMAQAKWSWWSTRQGYPVLDGIAAVKNQSGMVQVRALDPWFNIMAARVAAEGWRGAGDDYILEGPQSVREDKIFRGVGAFLRGMGWKTRKTNHALRAYAGSQIAMKMGIWDASVWLRHASVNVTQEHYMHFIAKWKPADLDSLPARWAVAPQVAAPQLRIVPEMAMAAGGAQ